MYLFFDTETTGLPKQWNAPVSNLSNWPRLVQLAWLLMDENGSEISSQDRIIRPEGFIIPQAASAVHGITTERALEEGIALSLALSEFAEALGNTRMLIAHNLSFDEKIMGAEFLRAEIESEIMSLPRVCTMHSSTEYCEIPGNYGYKWPKLMELHEKLFDEGFDGAHDALADVKACARCFFELKERGVIA